MRDGVAKPRGFPCASGSACLRWRVCKGTRRPAGAARSCSSVTPLGASWARCAASMSPFQNCAREPKPIRERKDDFGVRPRFSRRRHDRLAKLHQRLGVRADLEADLQRLALETRRDRQHDVGERRRGRHEEIGMGVEVQRRQRGATAIRIGLRQQQVRAEPDQAAHRIGHALEHRAVEIMRRYAVPARGAERAFGNADRGRHLLRGRQVLAGDRRRGDRRKQHIAAGRIEASGQGIEQRHRARGLGRVGVLLVSAPGIVGDRTGMPDQARGFFELRLRNPAGRLDHFGRIFCAQRGVVIEHGAAFDRARSWWTHDTCPASATASLAPS